MRNEPFGGKNLKEMAQDAIITAAVNRALHYDEGGFSDLAKAVRKEATRLAKRYGLSEVPGLPDTWKKS